MAPRDVLAEALDGAEWAALRAGEILRRLRDLVSRGKVSVRYEHLPQLVEEACVLAFIDAEALRRPATGSGSIRPRNGSASTGSRSSRC